MNSKGIVFEIKHAKLLLSENHYSSSVEVIRKIILLKELDWGWYKILDQYNNVGFINTNFF